MAMRAHNWDNGDFPVVISVPHAGTDYAGLAGVELAVPLAALQRFEDRRVDALCGGAVAAGVPVLVATQPRAWIDLNRAEDEFEAGDFAELPATIAPRGGRKAQAGLGLVPMRLAGNGALYRRRWRWPEIAVRIAQDYRPWHDALAAKLAALRDRHGSAILIDLHSMPPLRDSIDLPAARIVIGDRFGKSAGARITDAARAVPERAGVNVGLNSPYPGGHILDRHGDPANDVHALQVEIDRALYLDAELAEPGPGAAAMTRFVTDLATSLRLAIDRGRWLEAAE